MGAPAPEEPSPPEEEVPVPQEEPPSEEESPPEEEAAVPEEEPPPAVSLFAPRGRLPATSLEERESAPPPAAGAVKARPQAGGSKP